MKEDIYYIKYLKYKKKYLELKKKYIGGSIRTPGVINTLNTTSNVFYDLNKVVKSENPYDAVVNVGRTGVNLVDGVLATAILAPFELAGLSNAQILNKQKCIKESKKHMSALAKCAITPKEKIDKDLVKNERCAKFFEDTMKTYFKTDDAKNIFLIIQKKNRKNF